MIKITFICDWCDIEQDIPLMRISFFGRTITPIVSYKGHYGEYCHSNCKQAEKLAFEIADKKAWSERSDFLKEARKKTFGELRAISSDVDRQIKK